MADARAGAVGGRSHPAAFLDRDGVLNVDVGYAYRPDQLALTPTAAEGVRLLNEAGYLAIVVTNQAGVAYGRYGEPDIHAFHEALQAALRSEGAWIDAFYHCAFHPDGVVPAFTGQHPDRKPNPGMLLRAMADWPILREESFLIGDKDSDMEAAARAGVAGIRVPKDSCDLAAEARRLIAAARARMDR